MGDENGHYCTACKTRRCWVKNVEDRDSERIEYSVRRTRVYSPNSQTMGPCDHFLTRVRPKLVREKE